jgi:hypothetical protein
MWNRDIYFKRCVPGNLGLSMIVILLFKNFRYKAKIAANSGLLARFSPTVSALGDAVAGTFGQ